MTALFAFDLSQERLIGFALLGPLREKLTVTTAQDRAKVRDGRQECLPTLAIKPQGPLDSGAFHSKTSCGSGASLMEVNDSGLGLQQWSKRNSRSRLRNGRQKRQARVPAPLERMPAVLYLQTC